MTFNSPTYNFRSLCDIVRLEKDDTNKNQQLIQLTNYGIIK